MAIPGLTDEEVAMDVAAHAAMLCGGPEPTADWGLALARMRHGVPAVMPDRSADNAGQTPIAYGLVSAMAAAAEGRQAEAATWLENARRRLEAIKEETAFVASADRGRLWIVTTAFPRQLQNETDAALDAVHP